MAAVGHNLPVGLRRVSEVFLPPVTRPADGDAAHKLAQLVRQVEQGETFDVECWQALLRAQDRECGRIAQLATPSCG